MERVPDSLFAGTTRLDLVSSLVLGSNKIGLQLAGSWYWFDGPGRSTHYSPDGSEPYNWRMNDGDRIILRNFLAAYFAASTTERNAIKLMLSA